MNRSNVSVCALWYIVALRQYILNKCNKKKIDIYCYSVKAIFTTMFPTAVICIDNI